MNQLAAIVQIVAFLRCGVELGIVGIDDVAVASSCCSGSKNCALFLRKADVVDESCWVVLGGDIGHYVVHFQGVDHIDYDQNHQA